MRKIEKIFKDLGDRGLLVSIKRKENVSYVEVIVPNEKRIISSYNVRDMLRLYFEFPILIKEEIISNSDSKYTYINDIDNCVVANSLLSNNPGVRKTYDLLRNSGLNIPQSHVRYIREFLKEHGLTDVDVDYNAVDKVTIYIHFKSEKSKNDFKELMFYRTLAHE